MKDSKDVSKIINNIQSSLASAERVFNMLDEVDEFIKKLELLIIKLTN